MRRFALMWVGVIVACVAAPAQAHDLITAEASERYLAQASEHLNALRSQQPPAERAAASYALGRLLDEIRELLNRDLATHGRVQGLASNHLVAELARRGLRLEISPQLGRFPANLGYYREALRLSPDGAQAADARLRLLQGYFYDSFDDDPLRPRDQSWEQLAEQIRIGERLLQLAPAHPEREEVQFILLVHYVQAARSAPDPATRQQHARRARQLSADFLARYPDSMRAAAVPVLLGSGL